MYVLTSSSLIGVVGALGCKHAASTWDTTWLLHHGHMLLTERGREKESVTLHANVKKRTKIHCVSKSIRV